MTPQQNLKSKSMLWKFTNYNNALHCCYPPCHTLAAKDRERKDVESPKSKIQNLKFNILYSKPESVLWNCTNSVAALLCCHSLGHALNSVPHWTQNRYLKFRIQTPNSKLMLWNCTDSIAALQCCHPLRHPLVANKTERKYIASPKSKI